MELWVALPPIANALFGAVVWTTVWLGSGYGEALLTWVPGIWR